MDLLTQVLEKSFMEIADLIRNQNSLDLGSLSNEYNPFGCLRRGQHITVLYKQTSTKMSGDFLGRLVLGDEDGLTKVFGATIF